MKPQSWQGLELWWNSKVVGKTTRYQFLLCYYNTNWLQISKICRGKCLDWFQNCPGYSTVNCFPLPYGTWCPECFSSRRAELMTSWYANDCWLFVSRLPSKYWNIHVSGERLRGSQRTLTYCIFGADSRLASSQWETSLQSNAVSHWLGANLVWFSACAQPVRDVVAK